MFFATDNNPTVTTPTDYTLLGSFQPASTVGYYIYAKSADGDEGGGTENVQTSSSQRAVAHLYRISGWGGTVATDIDISTVNNASDSSTPDPSAVTAGWGADTNLFIAAVGAGDDDETANSGPGGWTNLQTTATGAGSNQSPSVHNAQLASSNASENPGTFSLSGSEAWAAYTLVIKPAGGIVQQAMYHYRNHGTI
jgi:hypothetical protein